MPKKRLFKDRYVDNIMCSKEAPPTNGMIKNKEIGKTHADTVEILPALPVNKKQVNRSSRNKKKC
jgi:hypothetical protein